MINRYILLCIACCLSHFRLLAQTGDDGFNTNVVSAYSKTTESARVSVLLMPGFSTTGNTFRAFISPDIQYHNARVETGGDFGQNFIRVYMPKADNATATEPAHLSLDYSKWFESISYFDGLGRLSQSIEVKSMPNGSDLVVPVKYNNMGRQSYQYLPYCIIQDGDNGAGGYRVNDVAEQQDFNNYFFKDEGIYAKSIQTYEPSPLDRIAQTIGPGKDWQTTGSEKPVQIFYETNIASDNIHLLSVNSSNELSRSGYYPAATLYKTRQLDENNNETSEYKDLQGRVIAKTAKVDGGKATTYYVYDDFGYLRYVIPPLTSDLVPATVTTYNLLTSWVKNYCYYYEYADTHKRMTTKKLPGCDPVYMVYNKRDILVLAQDGNQRLANKWSFIKYDKFNRPILTGIYTHTSAKSQSEMQDNVNLNLNYYEQFSTSNADPGYTSVAYPTTGYEIQTVTYYDNYTFLSVAGNAGDYAFKSTEMDFVNGESTSTKGMVTGTRSVALEHDAVTVADNKLLSVNRYDKYGRLIQTTADNHLGGKNITSIKYNFTGQILKTRDNHINTSATVDVNQRNEYDNGGRLTNTYYKIGSSPEILMTQNVYNELGQAKQKKLHGSGSAFVQTEDFQYNIRGWLEKINDVNKPGSDFFAFGLNYTAGSQYNGNISSMEWVSKQYPALKSYAFTYDELNRVKTAAYSPSAYYNENLTYDKNGNIKTLNRTGQTATNVYVPIDNLVYNYSGNQLINVNDATGTAYQNNGFSDNGSNTTNEYLYDQNGNLTKDLNKQIDNIMYSPQNLPHRIDMIASGQPKILYVYDATGRKLRKQTLLNQANVTQTDYDGSFVYVGGALSYIITPEGRALPDGSSYKYEYYLKDHLGNTRVAFDQNGTVLQDNSYYPFGMSIDGLNYTNTAQSAPNKYLYNGKELQDDFNLDWLDYGARFYDAVLGRWHTPDPLAHEDYNFSNYTYCHNNPINVIDPDGNSTYVLKNSDGTYRVVGGDLKDKDNNVYSFNFDKNGKYIGTSSIGVTTSLTSFYDSDNRTWAIGSIINPNDKSGKNFLANFANQDLEIGKYMEKAAGGEKYDFKRTNGTDNVISDNQSYFYRGMPVGKTENGKTIYTSARDVGNIAAGYITGRYLIPWSLARKEFDKLQSKQENRPAIEGASTQNAQRLGYEAGVNDALTSNIAGIPARTLIRWIRSTPTVYKRLK